MSPRLGLFLFPFIIAATVPSPASADDLAKIVSLACGARKTCEFVSVYPAGMSETGRTLAVVEIKLGPADVVGGPCRRYTEVFGGSELWLIEDGRAQPLVQGCFDGKFQVGKNRLTYLDVVDDDESDNIDTVHDELTDIIQLSPRHTIQIDYCWTVPAHHHVGEFISLDVPSMTARRMYAKDADLVTSALDATQAADLACAFMHDRIDGSAEAGFVEETAMPWPVTDDSDGVPMEQMDDLFRQFPALGGCATHWLLDGKSGYLMLGRADPAATAELRFLQASASSYVIEIRDPSYHVEDQAPSWMDADHIEFWVPRNEPGGNPVTPKFDGDPDAVSQIAVDLDGIAHAGIGNPVLPVIRRWESRDENNRPVIVLSIVWGLNADRSILPESGAAIVYSQAKNGKRRRVFSTVPMVKSGVTFVPIAIPRSAKVPVVCGVVNGRWDVIANPGLIIPSAYYPSWP
jgi:hypothetical protein